MYSDKLVCANQHSHGHYSHLVHWIGTGKENHTNNDHNDYDTNIKYEQNNIQNENKNNKIYLQTHKFLANFMSFISCVRFNMFCVCVGFYFIGFLVFVFFFRLVFYGLHFKLGYGRKIDLQIDWAVKCRNPCRTSNIPQFIHL